MRRISSAHPLLQASVHLARSEQSAIAARDPARAVHQYVNNRLMSLSGLRHSPLPDLADQHTELIDAQSIEKVFHFLIK